MAQLNSATWTGTYSSYSRNFCGYVIYTWEPDYSATQSRFQITQIGIRQTTSGSTSWAAGYGNVSVSGTGQTTKTATNAARIQWNGAANIAFDSTTTNWIWNKTTSEQNKTITVKGWKTKGDWTGSGTGTLTVKVPALASYAITYSANGGSGSIASQTKYYNTAITLSNGSGLTRTNYDLTGWATSGGTPYGLGASYSTNAALDLLAQWKLQYTKPTISNVKVYRVASSSSSTESDTGTYIYISFDYEGGVVGSTPVAPTVKITIDGTVKTTSAQSNTSGSYTDWYGTYSTDASHTVSIQLYDSNDTTGTIYYQTVSAATYAIDLIGSGVNVYMGVMTHAESGVPLKLEGFSTEGDIVLYLDDTAASGTDYEILTALDDLGWDVDAD